MFESAIEALLILLDPSRLVFMFLGIAVLELISFTGSAFQLTVALLIALLGAFNIFAGYRNYQLFRQYLK